MTLDYLEAHFRLRTQLRKADEMYYRLRTRAEPGAQNLAGMPHCPTGRKLEESSLTLVEMSKERDELIKQVEQSQIQIVEWVRTFDDSEVRAVLMSRWLEAMQWREIGELLHLTPGQCLLRWYKAREVLEEKQ